MIRFSRTIFLKAIVFAFFSVLILFSTQQSMAQPCPSSPFRCPESNDTCFIVDCGYDLDTDCIYRSEGPIEFIIEVPRYVAPVMYGYLQNPQDLVNNGVVSPYATLSMPIFDVDIGCDESPDCVCEYDAIYFNGHFIDYSYGLNRTWVKNELQIPIEFVKFAKIRGEPAANTIRIDIDTKNDRECWCTAVDWAALSFKAARPVILVHGFVGSAIVWEDQWNPWRF